MARSIRLAFILGLALATAGCGYIVVPADPTPTAAPSGAASAAPDLGWSAVATKIEPASGGLHVELAIRNDTGDWSEMHAAEGKPAHLSAGGKDSDCATVTVGTGGHRLAPGFRMRAYEILAKPDDKAPTVQPLVVECAGATAYKGTLSIDYTYVTGIFDYYDASRQTSKTLTVDLGAVAGDLAYPIATQVQNLVEKPGAAITAINDCRVTLKQTTRTDKGLQFTWESQNPGDYRTQVHLESPVVAADGVIYGVFESPDEAESPFTEAKSTIEWTTTAPVPADVKGAYILASIESIGQKEFANHVIDVADK